MRLQTQRSKVYRGCMRIHNDVGTDVHNHTLKLNICKVQSDVTYNMYIEYIIHPGQYGRYDLEQSPIIFDCQGILQQRQMIMRGNFLAIARLSFHFPTSSGVFTIVY